MLSSVDISTHWCLQQNIRALTSSHSNKNENFYKHKQTNSGHMLHTASLICKKEKSFYFYLIKKKPSMFYQKFNQTTCLTEKQTWMWRKMWLKMSKFVLKICQHYEHCPHLYKRESCYKSTECYTAFFKLIVICAWMYRIMWALLFEIQAESTHIHST